MVATHEVNRSMRRSASLIYLVFSFLVLYAGDCSDGIRAFDDNRETDGIETDLTDPAAVIEAHDLALSRKSYAAYEALLDDEFEFFPSDQDRDDLPWMTTDSWSRTTELDIAFNLFDPNHTQGNGSVDLIEMDSTPVVEFRVHYDGSIEGTCSARGRAMWTASDGASFDTWFRFTLVERNGTLRIREIRELEGAGRPSPDPDLSSTWGRIKAAFR